LLSQFAAEAAADAVDQPVRDAGTTSCPAQH
jgi:hypothetical protein